MYHYISNMVPTSSTSRQDHDRDPPPWPHPPWLTTRPQLVTGSTCQGAGARPPPLSERRERSSLKARCRLGLFVIGEDETVFEFFGQLWPSTPHRRRLHLGFRPPPTTPTPVSSSGFERISWCRRVSHQLIVSRCEDLIVLRSCR